jgi:hypothetical protein
VSVRSPATVGLAVVVALAIAAVDVFAPPPPSSARSPEVLAVATPVTGTATCVVGDGREGTGTSLAVARPDGLGDGAAGLELRVLGGGEVARTSLPTLAPGEHLRVGVGADAEQALGVDWRGGPVAVTRTWRLAPGDDLPAGTVAGPCPSEVASRWVLPGMITVGGSEARIRVANPFGTDATIAIGFVTPEGPEEPIALQNLSVPARGAYELDVNEVLPERADLAAVVRVLSGRAVVEGYQLTRAAIGDIDGASLLAASTSPSETWTVPWVADTDAEDPWLWVLNLGDRPAPVELTLHTADGGIPPEGLTEVTVAPGQLRRIDLRGTLPEGVSTAAITARSDGAPIHVAGAVQRAADEPAATGFAVQLGVPAPAASWIVSGGTVPEGRRERLQVVNPGSEPAELDVVVSDGSSASAPPELQGIVLGPGEQRQLVLDEVVADAPAWSAFVTATTGEVVVGRLGSGGGGGGLHLVATPGIPGTTWDPAGLGLPTRAAPGTVQRLGTDRGADADD